MLSYLAGVGSGAGRGSSSSEARAESKEATSRVGAKSSYEEEGVSLLNVAVT